VNSEERELPAPAGPITASELKKGAVYFAVNYVDDNLLIPVMETLVFIGLDLEPGDSGLVYFQDVGSYLRGIRYGVASKEDFAEFFAGSENEVSHIFEYEHALGKLVRCAIRRRKKRGGLTPRSGSK
jgi:hypothetical protein